jgi:hypothetical protein
MQKGIDCSAKSSLHFIFYHLIDISNLHEYRLLHATDGGVCETGNASLRVGQLVLIQFLSADHHLSHFMSQPRYSKLLFLRMKLEFFARTSTDVQQTTSTTTQDVQQTTSAPTQASSTLSVPATSDAQPDSMHTLNSTPVIAGSLVGVIVLVVCVVILLLLAKRRQRLRGEPILRAARYVHPAQFPPDPLGA